MAATSHAGSHMKDSPLKIFVLAKRRINEIYGQIEEHVQESHAFLAGVQTLQSEAAQPSHRDPHHRHPHHPPPHEDQGRTRQNLQNPQANSDLIMAILPAPTTVDQVESYADKISGIRDVLARDHMKVAFFGRTSNGKSTVINSVLQRKILPSGIGHTTNCFLQVEGTDEDDPYLVSEQNVACRLAVESVSHLANALNNEKELMGDSTLVRVFWPKDKCHLLRDDVVLVDSPGIDVSPNLDEWIDKHCLDSDIFVLVSNAESTLMQTEKAFFHKVSEKLSQPNVFILHNRWDASAAEPETEAKVRKQHLTRSVAFLCDELRVLSDRTEAAERVFFVSAKEALQARLKAEAGEAPEAGALVPSGFQARLTEFETFERRFAECLSKSAVRTKFDQHAKKGKAVCHELCRILDFVQARSAELRDLKLSERDRKRELLAATQRRIIDLTEDTRQQIHVVVDHIESKVCLALSEEIRRLSALVNDFQKPFTSDSIVLTVYKKELHAHVERGLGSNLRGRLSSAIGEYVEATQRAMLEAFCKALPPPADDEDHRRGRQAAAVVPARNFEILYKINCESLCADFREDLEFRFTFSAAAIIRKFFGAGSYLVTKVSSSSASAAAAAAASSGLGRSDSLKSLPPTAPQTPSNERSLNVSSGSSQAAAAAAGDLSAQAGDMLGVVSKFALIAPQSQSTIGLLAAGGFLVRTIGWRVIFIVTGSYAVLYLYERLTWTAAAKERTFKKQYVAHATKKLKLIVDLTSSNCSHQVQQELTSTFARLCHLTEEVIRELDVDIGRLDEEVLRLEESSNSARRLKTVSAAICSEIDNFVDTFLPH